jgi:hypothetical protein
MTDSAVLIKRYGLSIPDADGVMRGSAWYLDVAGLSLRVPPTFALEHDWCNGFREVYINVEERAIFTYCEGDLDLTVDATQEAWRARYAAAIEFYKTH